MAIRPQPRLSSQRIAILVESDFYEPEIFFYQQRFAEEGAEVTLLSRLWGKTQMEFTGHEFRAPLEVTGSIEHISDQELDSYAALIVPSGMVADRLRYSENVNTLSPAAELLRRAFARSQITKGIICHGLMLVSAMPYLAHNRRLTCHNNLIGDARNMGAQYIDEDVVVDGDLVTGRTGEHCNVFTAQIIAEIESRRLVPA
jgi:protease I